MRDDIDFDSYDDNGNVSDPAWGGARNPFMSLVETGQEIVAADIPFVVNFLERREQLGLGGLSEDGEFAALALVCLKNEYAWYE